MFWGPGFYLVFDGIRLYITLESLYANLVRGLCGTFNFQNQDDFLASNNIIETNLIQFADSFKIDLSTLTPEQSDPCVSVVI